MDKIYLKYRKKTEREVIKIIFSFCTVININIGLYHLVLTTCIIISIFCLLLLVFRFQVSSGGVGVPSIFYFLFIIIIYYKKLLEFNKNTDRGVEKCFVFYDSICF